MKIFRNRGDIYISKSGYKSSREERILIILLVLIVIFTVTFFVILSNRYSSVSDFLAGEKTTVENNISNEEILPSISGKTNYLVFETDDEESVIHYIFLIEADADSLAYKVCTLSPDMDIDGESLYDIYSYGGGASLQTKLTSYLGIDIDYYAAFSKSSFIKFLNKLGMFIYLSDEKVSFNGGSEDDTYTVRLSEGEQTISASETSNLLRYYSNEKNDYSKANNIILYGLTRLFNENNYEDNQSLFRLFISSASTNITVRNFEDGRDKLSVFCKKNMDVTVYSVVSEYNKKILTDTAVKEIKGYFSK